ncbi:hypothetical protein EI94DRAFT_1835042 [Lactarius quietus]|nr:hypothetical protein EI94DRAFT_1835042 [Lactarius quietus]
MASNTGTSIPGSGAGSNHNPAPTSTPPSVLEKRTFGSSGSASMASETEASASSKRARKYGPVHGRPMPLRLEDESELATVPESNSKGKRIQRTSSYYPGRGDHNHDLAQLDPNNNGFYTPRVDDHNGSLDGDWNDDEQELQLAIKNPSRFSEVMANERPSWMSSDADISPSTPLSHGNNLDNVDSSAILTDRASVVSTPRPATNTVPIAVSATTDANLPGGNISLAAPDDNPTKGNTSAEPDAQVNTDLVFLEGSAKLMLTHQRPIIRAIVQDAIDRLRVSLLVRNAFPEPVMAIAFTKDALRLAAERSDKPGATTVQARLQDDDEYVTKLVSLPRARISLICSEVKDCMNAICFAAILGIGSATEVARVIGKQLSCYTYTFPRVLPNFGAGGLVKRSQPYRNERIVAVIRELYFTGGSASFASRFGHLFPVHFGDNGRPSRKVPVPMVALVATALYATLYEWRTGEQQAHEFSANAYMDVYAGHVNTLRHIMENREGAFHIMMSDIHTRASTTPGTPSTAAPIAELDLNTLEE